jgi:hypothetical protein
MRCPIPQHAPIVGSPGGITSTLIPGQKGPESDIIKCGRAGQDMCTLCDLIKGMNLVIKYLMRIAIGVALLAMAIGGVMYIVSAGGSELIGQAKSTMKNAAIGFVIIFAGWLIINTTITYLGTAPGMGIEITSWGEFDCNRTVQAPN